MIFLHERRKVKRVSELKDGNKKSAGNDFSPREKEGKKNSGDGQK